jgi:hypothetical protein
MKLVPGSGNDDSEILTKNELLVDRFLDITDNIDKWKWVLNNKNDIDIILIDQHGKINIILKKDNQSPEEIINPDYIIEFKNTHKATLNTGRLLEALGFQFALIHITIMSNR